MKLPENFDFKNGLSGNTYEANLVGKNYIIACDVIGLPTGYFKFTVSQVINYVKEGVWVIQAESFIDLGNISSALQILISEKNDASELTYEELRSLRLTRGLINRLLNDR